MDIADNYALSVVMFQVPNSSIFISNIQSHASVFSIGDFSQKKKQRETSKELAECLNAHKHNTEQL